MHKPKKGVSMVGGYIFAAGPFHRKRIVMQCPELPGGGGDSKACIVHHGRYIAQPPTSK